MAARDERDPTAGQNHTNAERKSDRELVITRIFDAPARLVFEAWTRPALFMQWWAPKSMGVPLLSCEMDVRIGGTYRVVFGRDLSESAAFVGRYLDVVPNTRLVWTNEESDDGAVTTVTFEEKGSRTLLTLHELYPTKEALDEALAGMEEGMPEQFAQLDELLLTLATRASGA
ncbi:MAG: SRPBCC family protein [Proteobacteria bacterium]|nr:SRPBCC family protein [Pseudomonadota bacterium]